tara:strand:- start:243 stop:743 length:501 start_codon:yes stop_codon:yes gene_type:complete
MSWKGILKADLESKILSEIEKEGGALGMKNLKQFGEEAEIKQTLSKLRKEGKIFMHEDGDIYTHNPESIEKFFGRKQQQDQFTSDGIKFQNQNDLNVYNQAKGSLGVHSSVLTNYLKNQGNVFVGSQIIQQGISQAQSKQQQKQRMPKRSPSPRMPTESDFRRPAY